MWAILRIYFLIFTIKFQFQLRENIQSDFYCWKPLIITNSSKETDHPPLQLYFKLLQRIWIKTFNCISSLVVSFSAIVFIQVEQNKKKNVLKPKPDLKDKPPAIIQYHVNQCHQYDFRRWLKCEHCKKYRPGVVFESSNSRLLEQWERREEEGRRK